MLRRPVFLPMVFALLLVGAACSGDDTGGGDGGGSDGSDGASSVTVDGVEIPSCASLAGQTVPDVGEDGPGTDGCTKDGTVEGVGTRASVNCDNGGRVFYMGDIDSDAYVLGVPGDTYQVGPRGDLPSTDDLCAEAPPG